MYLYKLKQGVSRLSDINFFRFYDWFEKYGWNRIDKFTKSSKLRQAVLNLSDKELDNFSDWLDILWAVRWDEEVDNDPIARQCIELGNIIMSKFANGQLNDELHGFDDDSKDKKER
jgi:hypothetical protein